MSIETKSANAQLDGDHGTVKAVIATLNEVDRDGDMIPDGAIADGTPATLSFYNHDTVFNQMNGIGGPDAPPVGKGAVYIENGKAIFKGKYFMETQRGQEAFKTVRAVGPDQAWSFAYRLLDATSPAPWQWAKKGARRVLNKLGPLIDGAMEVSPVKWPAGIGTGTLEARSARRPLTRPCGCELCTRESDAADLRRMKEIGQRALRTIRERCERLEPYPADLKRWIPTYRRERVARIVFDAACKRWGVRVPPELKWFKDNDRAIGLYFPVRREAWCSTQLSLKETALTVAHELRHHLQAERGEADIAGDVWGERECDSHATVLVNMMERYGELDLSEAS